MTSFSPGYIVGGMIVAHGQSVDIKRESSKPARHHGHIGRVLIIGAGASIEEAIRANCPPERHPPTIANFAERLWRDSPLKFFVYWLPEYLTESGIDPGNDPLTTFIEASKDPSLNINVERLFEYCWNHKGEKFKEDWINLIYHGIMNPLNELLLSVFFKNGEGLMQLEASKYVASKLRTIDVVLNLNYDTLFEIGAQQQGIPITYAPNPFSGQGILVAKPHGSMNLLADESSFWFAQANCLGALPSGGDNFRNYNAIVPPRFNKEYLQHPISNMILFSVKDVEPAILTFWGVGLTGSDIDLIELYGKWANFARVIEVVNPDRSVVETARAILGKPVRHFVRLEDWGAAQ